jgi:hypothetical protein
MTSNPGILHLLSLYGIDVSPHLVKELRKKKNGPGAAEAEETGAEADNSYFAP